MLGIMVLIGCVISRIINIDIFINSALFALVLIYGFNTLVFWATSKVRFAVAAITGLIQPVLIMTMYILITFLFIDTSFMGPVIFQIILKAFVASIIFFAFGVSFCIPP